MCDSVPFLGHSLYGVIVMNGLLVIVKATKWFWIFSDELLSQTPLFYIIGTVVIALLTLNVIDVMTALAEVSESVRPMIITIISLQCVRERTQNPCATDLLMFELVIAEN